MRAPHVALLLALAASGCATAPTATLNAFAARSADNSFEIFDRAVSSPTALVLPVVHDRQTSGPSCGAHALASVINYWHGPRSITGEQIFRETPPAARNGYSVAELVQLAAQRDLLASAVRLPEQGLIDELEHGRPILVPVRLPAIYIQPDTLPGENAPGFGVVAGTITYRVGRISEWTGLAMVDHYLLVAGMIRTDLSWLNLCAVSAPSAPPSSRGIVSRSAMQQLFSVRQRRCSMPKPSNRRRYGSSCLRSAK